MKAILEFDLNDSDDQLAHKRCVLATEMALVIWQLSYNTKKEVERIIENAKEDDKNINAYDGVDLVFEKLNDLLEEHGIKIDSLIV